MPFDQIAGNRFNDACQKLRLFLIDVAVPLAH